MDNDKTKKLTALISKLTVAANKAVAKMPEQKHETRTKFSITGLNTNSAFDRRGNLSTFNLLRN